MATDQINTTAPAPHS